MGTADLVPGISGGTIAFMMGFYDELLTSLKTLNKTSLKLFFTFQWKALSRTVAWRFLLPLVSGILFAFVVLANFFHFILGHEQYRVYLYAGFLGLILASFIFCVRQIKAWKWRYGMGLLMGAIIAYNLTDPRLPSELEGEYAIAWHQSASVSLFNYDVQSQQITHLSKETLAGMLAKKIASADTSIYDQNGEIVGVLGEFVQPHYGYRLDPWLMLCGAIAICALLLPGISGSYLLTLLGVYPLVIAALAEFVAGLKQASFDQEAFFILFSLGIGILAGVMLFARFVSWLLNTYHDATVATLSGFMIGALRSVWPFWSYSYMIQPLKPAKGLQLVAINPIWPETDVGYACLAFVVGFALVFIVEYANQKPLINEKIG